MIDAIILNFKKDIKSHFCRSDAHPFLMTICAFCIGVVMLLTALLINSGSIIIADINSLDPTMTVMLYSVSVSAILAMLAPLALDSNILEEMRVIGRLRLVEKRHRTGIILISKFLTSFLFMEFAYVIGFFSLKIGLNRLFGISILAGQTEALAVMINTSAFVFLISAITTFSFTLEMPKGLRYALLPIFIASLLIISLILKPDMLIALTTPQSIQTLTSLYLIIASLAISITLTVFSYLISKIKRAAKVI